MDHTTPVPTARSLQSAALPPDRRRAPAQGVPRRRTHQWLGGVRIAVDRRLNHALRLSRGEREDRRWAEALEEARRFALRPGKRLRPALLLVGFGLATGRSRIPQGLWSFAAGVEILHAFSLIHDDVADRADTRRGGPTLHRVLGPGSLGENLAVVVGDCLFARALETMLDSRLPRADRALRHYLRVCRHAARGQFHDLDLSRVPLGKVTPAQSLGVARLKTASLGFAAPLVGGALLGGGEQPLCRALARVGHHLGLAFQIRNDLVGLFGEADFLGASSDRDLVQGTRTFPLVAAYRRAPRPGQSEIDDLWSRGIRDRAAVDRARTLVEAYRGRTAAERAVARACLAAHRVLDDAIPAGPWRHRLSALITLVYRPLA